MKNKTKIILLLLLITALVLSGCKDESEINLQEPNTWAKKEYSNHYKKLEKEILKDFESSKTSIKPNTIIGGNIDSHSYTATDKEGSFKITIMTTQYFRYNAERIKSSEIDYKKENKLIYKEAEEAKKETNTNFALSPNSHLAVDTQVLVYDYYFDKDGKLLNKINITNKLK